MKEVLKKDLYRYEGTRSRRLLTKIRYILFTPGYQFTYFWRNASLAHNPVSKFFWRIMHRICMFHTGIQIPVGTKIGYGLKIGHFGNIVINPEAVIGCNFSIAQGCLIGNSQGKKAGVPTIGDYVIMGANSLIVGGGNYRRLCYDCSGRICEF